MQKTFEGIVVSIKMQKTAVVQVTSHKEHPMYKKLVKRDRKIKADTNNVKPSIGDRVKIVETRPLSSDKHFKIQEVIKNGTA